MLSSFAPGSKDYWVLNNPRVVTLLNATNVVPIKVDLTGKSLAGSKKLMEAGRRTLPYLVVYAPDGREVFSSDAYTAEQLVHALTEAAGAGRNSEN